MIHLFHLLLRKDPEYPPYISRVTKDSSNLISVFEVWRFVSFAVLRGQWKETSSSTTLRKSTYFSQWYFYKLLEHYLPHFGEIQLLALLWLIWLILVKSFKTLIKINSNAHLPTFWDYSFQPFPSNTYKDADYDLRINYPVLRVSDGLFHLIFVSFEFFAFPHNNI